MKDLQKEIQDSIEKNLPKQVGDTLRKRLEEADRLETSLKVSEGRVETLSRELSKSIETIEEYKRFDERNAALEVREKELKEKEIKFEIETLTYQLAAEKDKTEFSKNIALGLVRNTNYRKAIFDSENPGGYPMFDGQGNAHYPIATDRNYTETKTEE